LVTDVGLVNDGLTRSIRLLDGAIGRHPLPPAGLMQLGPASIVAAAAGLVARGDEPPEPLHAPVTSAAATPTLISVCHWRYLGRRTRFCPW
jgi:hypothetical protein